MDALKVAGSERIKEIQEKNKNQTDELITKQKVRIFIMMIC